MPETVPSFSNSFRPHCTSEKFLSWNPRNILGNNVGKAGMKRLKWQEKW